MKTSRTLLLALFVALSPFALAGGEDDRVILRRTSLDAGDQGAQRNHVW